MVLQAHSIAGGRGFKEDERPRLKGKGAVATGASRGGWAMAQALPAEGAEVLAVSRTGAPENDLAARGRLCRQKADLASAQDIESLFNRATQLWGRMDVLINNAGVQLARSVEGGAAEDCRQLSDVNMRWVFPCCSAAWPEMPVGFGSRLRKGWRSWS